MSQEIIDHQRWLGEHRVRAVRRVSTYAPPNHIDGVFEYTRANSEDDNEHFDGKITE